MSRIGFIGTGHIAAPLVRFLARKGHQITVTARSAAISAPLVREFGVTATDAQGVIDASDILVLCLRPQHAATVLRPLSFRTGQQIISVMAGVDLATLQTLCAPAQDFTQTIPLGFLEQGGCPLACLGNDALLTSLFSPENPVVKVADEAALNAHFAICALVPGLLDLMASGAGWLSAKTGSDQAEFYTSQLVSGFLAAMAKDAPGQLAQERDALATPDTLSLQMTDGLRQGGAHDALTATLTAIGKRLETT
jgi:pyrroline-5-carboxylate reductase